MSKSEAAVLQIGLCTLAGFIPIGILFGINITPVFPEELMIRLSKLAYAGPPLGLAIGLYLAQKTRSRRD